MRNIGDAADISEREIQESSAEIYGSIIGKEAGRVRNLTSVHICTDDFNDSEKRICSERR